MEKTQYHVYKQDLKFRRHRGIDPLKAKWTTDVKKDYDEDHDTVEYRLKEGKDCNYEYLDFTDLDLTEFPEIPSDICKKIINLFINTNKIKKSLNVSKFINLKVLDCSDNEIEEIIVCSDSKIEELVCKNNCLEKLPKTPHIVRLDCSNNAILDITIYPKMRTLTCKSNLIKKLNGSLKLKNLNCSENPIKYIGDYNNIEVLDISTTKMTNIDTYMPKLNTLFMNNTSITSIPVMETLEFLEMSDSPVKKLPYMPNITSVVASHGILTDISSQYRSIKTHMFVHKGKFIVITIKRDCD